MPHSLFDQRHKATYPLCHIFSEKCKKASCMRRSKLLMPQLNLGKIPSKFKSSIKFASDKELSKFVNHDIQNGPQIVSIPVPPYRHAFLVDVQKDKIMVADWRGDRYITRGIKGDANYDPNWKQYSELMKLLIEKYHRRLTTYPVDKTLFEVSMRHHLAMGGGGCSFYLFAWLPTQTQYSKYEV